MRIVALALLILAALVPAQAGDDLYNRMGQKEGLSRIAARTIDYAMADERIKEAFAQTNIPRLKGLLAAQFCVLTGGPCKYHGRSMEESHRGMNVQDMHFNALVEDLQQAMDDEGIGFATQNEFLALLAPMHGDMVKP